MPKDEELLEMGYMRIQVAKESGTDLVFLTEAGYEIAYHVDAGTELWVTLTDDQDYARLYDLDSNSEFVYILWDDVVVTLKNETDEEFEPRSIELISSKDLKTDFSFGETITMEVVPSNFRENDTYTVNWYYSADGGENYTMIEEAEGLIYSYELDFENSFYRWRVNITLLNEEEEENTIE